MNAINSYKESSLARCLCGAKPFGSRHWEYPWAVSQSGILENTGLRILDVAPDFTFPYADFLASKNHVTFIDLQKKKWSDFITWGADPAEIEKRPDYRLMDVQDMVFADETFDVIFCISVLEHLVCPTQNPDHPDLTSLFSADNAQQALVEMRRCLKFGGKLLLTVDIYGGPKWKCLFDLWDIFHDINTAGFDGHHFKDFDRNKAFNDLETFISEFHGPYITLGFCLEK